MSIKKNIIITSGHPDIDSFVELMIAKFSRDRKRSALSQISDAPIHKLFNPDEPDDRFDMFNTNRDTTVLIGIQDVLDADRRNNLLKRYEQGGSPVFSRHVLVIARHEDYDKAVYLSVPPAWLVDYESGNYTRLTGVFPHPNHYI